MKRINHALGLLLLVILVGFTGCELPTVYESEPNNERSNANTFHLGTHKGDIFPAEDVDVWAINVSGDGKTHTFTLSNMYTNLQMLLYVCDYYNNNLDPSELPAGVVLPITAYQESNINEQVSFTANTACRLIIQIEEAGDTIVSETGSYWLTHDSE